MSWSWNDGIAKARLATGLTLFAYVLTHNLNHALGLVSLDALETGREIFLAFWRFLPIEIVFILSILVHGAIALRALYRRRAMRMPWAEAAQLVFGLSLPPLLMLHVAATALAHDNLGVRDSYAYVLIGLWAQAPDLVVLQSAALLVAWIHGAIGLFYWLRLKSWFPAWAGALTIAAWLVPLLAWLGFMIAGRDILAILADPDRLAAIAARDRFPDAAAIAQIYAWRDFGLLFYGLLLGGVIAARALRHWANAHRAIAIAYAHGRTIRIRPGTTLLEASRLGDIPHASVCGGRGRCSTCRVRIVAGAANLPPPSETESKVLARVGAAPGTRLACQTVPRGSVEIEPLLPAQAGPRQAQAQADYHAGKDMEIAVLFADIRGFTHLAEQRLPYDIVFLLNRYFRAMAEAIEGSGGRIDKFIGDGIMALFGLDGSPERACAEALAAARRMAEALDAFNAAFRVELAAPLRIGIGIHFGPAIIGDMGVGGRHGVTAIGDTVNTASRLEAATKDIGCQVLVSQTVATLGKIPEGRFPAHEIELRGRRERLAAIAIDDGKKLER